MNSWPHDESKPDWNHRAQGALLPTDPPASILSPSAPRAKGRREPPSSLAENESVSLGHGGDASRNTCKDRAWNHANVGCFLLDTRGGHHRSSVSPCHSLMVLCKPASLVRANTNKHPQCPRVRVSLLPGSSPRLKYGRRASGSSWVIDVSTPRPQGLLEGRIYGPRTADVGSSELSQVYQA